MVTRRGTINQENVFRRKKQYTIIIIHIMVRIVYFVHETYGMYRAQRATQTTYGYGSPGGGCLLPSSGYLYNYTK